jgi:hypothetical protein
MERGQLVRSRAASGRGAVCPSPSEQNRGGRSSAMPVTVSCQPCVVQRRSLEATAFAWRGYPARRLRSGPYGPASVGVCGQAVRAPENSIRRNGMVWSQNRILSGKVREEGFEPSTFGPGGLAPPGSKDWLLEAAGHTRRPRRTRSAGEQRL